MITTGLLVAKTLGRDVLSTTGVVNRKGYAGYETLSGLVGGKWLDRHRVLASEYGRWITRDDHALELPNALYEYVESAPIGFVDPTGQLAMQCSKSPSSPSISGSWTATDTMGGGGSSLVDIHEHNGKLMYFNHGITADGSLGLTDWGIVAYMGHDQWMWESSRDHRIGTITGADPNEKEWATTGHGGPFTRQ